jgi:hypothetical protein
MQTGIKNIVAEESQMAAQLHASKLFAAACKRHSPQ